MIHAYMKKIENLTFGTKNTRTMIQDSKPIKTTLNLTFTKPHDPRFNFIEACINFTPHCSWFMCIGPWFLIHGHVALEFWIFVIGLRFNGGFCVEFERKAWSNLTVCLILCYLLWNLYFVRLSRRWCRYCYRTNYQY